MKKPSLFLKKWEEESNTFRKQRINENKGDLYFISDLRDKLLKKSDLKITMTFDE